MILPRNVTARKFVRALLRDGFVFVRQKGSIRPTAIPMGER